jgi:hypothetical protein
MDRKLETRDEKRVKMASRKNKDHPRERGLTVWTQANDAAANNIRRAPQTYRKLKQVRSITCPSPRCLSDRHASSIITP